MLSELVHRDAMISDCATWYGCHPRFFRKLTQPALDHAWLVASAHFG